MAIINPTHASFVDAASPDQVQDGTTTIYARQYHPSNPNVGKIALIHFDLSSLSGNQILSTTLNFQAAANSNLNEMNPSGYFNVKSIVLMPYAGWSNLVFNDLKMTGLTYYLSFHAWEIVHAFVPALANPHNCTVDANRNVAMDLTESIKSLAGFEFVIVIEDHQGWELGIKTSSINLDIQSQIIPADTRRFYSIQTPAWINADAITDNAMTGLHWWMDQHRNPNFRGSEEYHRYTWDQFETAQGVYDFSALEANIQQAINRNRRYAFRLRAMTANGNNLPAYLQSYIISCSGYTDVPNFNDPFVVTRSQALVEALAAQYNGDPRIAWIDIGMGGRYGEWVYPCDPLTIQVEQAYMDQWFDNFPDTQLLIVRGGNYSHIEYGLAKPAGIPVGLRGDIVGNDKFGHRTFDMWYARTMGLDAYNALKNQWKVAPWVGETDGPQDEMYLIGQGDARIYHITTTCNGRYDWNTLTQSQQDDFDRMGLANGYKYRLNSLKMENRPRPGQTWNIVTNWSNLGNCPTYESWDISLEIWNNDKAMVHSFSLGIDLRQVLPTYNPVSNNDMPVEFNHRLTIPDIPLDTYRLRLSVTDPTGICQPMKLYSNPNLGRLKLRDYIHLSRSRDINVRATEADNDEGVIINLEYENPSNKRFRIWIKLPDETEHEVFVEPMTPNTIWLTNLNTRAYEMTVTWDKGQFNANQ